MKNSHTKVLKYRTCCPISLAIVCFGFSGAILIVAPASAQNEALPVKMFSPAGRTYTMPAVLPKRRKISPSEKAVRLNEQGVELAFQGQRDRGIAKIKQALAFDPNNTTILYNLAGLHLANGESAPAIALMQRALAIDSSDISFLKRQGDAYVMANDVPSAVSSYEKVAEINSAYGDVLLKLGTLYGMQREFEKAEATLKKASAILGSDPRIDSNLGNILIARKKYKEAIVVLERAYEANHNAENAVALGIAYESTGDYKQAIKYFRQARKLGESGEDLDQHISQLKSALAKSQ